MKVSNIRTNCMGTISFDAKFQGMRKPQDFIVYPNPEVDEIRIQSDTRCGIIKSNGATEIATCTVFAMMNFAKRASDTIENIDELLAAIRGTASPMAGSNGIVFCDNSTASEV